jgi:hypothetical protein
MGTRLSGDRKAAFYIGTALMIVGGIAFGYSFVMFGAHFGDFSNFEADTKSWMATAFGGMALVLIGRIVRGIGVRGLAGSGILLDPERARQDLEPYSRMAGGMVKDALEEANVDVGGRPAKVVAINCSSCGKLNEEDSQFCQECGQRF